MGTRQGARGGAEQGALQGPNHSGYEFFATQAEWEALLGITLHWGVVFNGGTLPFADIVGSNDIDVATEGSPTLDATWPGAGGGGAYQQNTTGNERICSTNADFLAPTTGNFCMFGAFKRGGLVDDAFAGIWDQSNGNGSGLRCIEENGPADNRLWFTGENQSSVTRNLTLSLAGQVGTEDIVYFLFTRSASTVLEVWAAVEGSGVVLHENVTLSAADDFDSTSALMCVGRNAALGAMNQSMMVKGLLYSRGQAGSADLFDTFRGATRTSIVEV